MIVISIGEQAFDWIDAAGKLGPVIVAAIVGYIGYRQYADGRVAADRQAGTDERIAGIAARQQSIEEQSHRLSLLEARRPVVIAVEEASTAYLLTGAVNDQISLAVSRAAREARYLFPHTLWEQVRDLSNTVAALARLEHSLAAAAYLGTVKPVLADELSAAQAAASEQFTAVSWALSDEMRVEGNDPTTRLASLRKKIGPDGGVERAVVDNPDQPC